MLDLSEETGQLVRGILFLTIGVWVLSGPIREHGVKEFLKTLVDFEGGAVAGILFGVLPLVLGIYEILGAIKALW
tara:strand:+ start:117 stop:341 length:225 start_codon:yes stop_codon:yes gene_type:complete